MDKYREKLRRQSVATGLAAVFFSAAAYLLGTVWGHAPDSGMTDFIMGFQAGVAGGVIAGCVFVAARNVRRLRSAEALKKAYIAETDERRLFILQKTGAAGLLTVIYALAVSAVIAGFFNSVVFLTLLAACFFTELVLITLKIYFRFKY